MQDKNESAKYKINHDWKTVSEQLLSWEKVKRLSQHRFVNYIYSHHLWSEKSQWCKRDIVLQSEEKFLLFCSCFWGKDSPGINTLGEKKKTCHAIQASFNFIIILHFVSIRRYSIFPWNSQQNNIYESITSDQNMHHKIIPLRSLSKFLKCRKN